MWIMGGLLGLVGLGRVNGSQKTTPLDALLLTVEGSTSGFSFEDKMELCETPVEWDLEMRLAAVGVAVCKTGRLMTGLEGTKGNVEDFGKVGFLSEGSEGEVEPPHGNVLVLDSSGIVTEVVGLLAMTSETVVLISSFFFKRTTGLGGGGGAFLAFVGDVVLVSTAVGDDSLLDFSDLLEDDETAFSSVSAVALRLLALWLVLAARG